ncbi:MAG: YlbF family regulator [Clostridia bacterium]
MEIFDKARELGEAIVNSDEYKALKLAEAKQEQDEEAMKLLQEYSAIRKTLGEEINKGDVSEERMEEIRNAVEEAYEKVTSNDIIADYINAQRAFQAIIDQMNTILSYHITGQLPGGCSGSCGSCGGCH